jgi:bifunctional DNA-binding transcriptional regulator/antitoxin component of YhaV-PrlF toxin-antitoxin module
MEEKPTRKLIKNGRGSYYVCIPKEIVKKYGWQDAQKMTIADKGRGKVEISDWKKR